MTRPSPGSTAHGVSSPIARAAALSLVALVSLALSAVASLASSGPASAADNTFLVNSTGDAPAAGSTSDGVCDTGGTVDGQPECTLRAAIEEANGTTGSDAIDATGIGGTIQLGSRLHISSDLELTGPGADALTVRGEGDTGGYQVFYITDADAVTLSGLTVADGTAAPTSPAAAIDAGGIMNFSAATLTLDAVVVTGNHLTGFYAGAGGVASTGDLVIRNSTVSANSANGSVILGQGGGIAIGNSKTLTVTNSTIGDNHVLGGASGGGGIRSTGPVQLDSVTFAGNTATGSGTPARDIWVQGGTVTTGNTIFGSTAASGIDCKSISGFVSLGHNLEADDGGSCGLTDPTDRNEADPQLGALADNGGPTPQFAFPPSSPAADTGQTDEALHQRAIGRPQGAADDIGAFELDTTAPDTVIDSGPAEGSTTADDSPSLGFHATEAGSSFECELDGPGAATGTFASCASPWSYADLAHGSYLFLVRAIDGAGNVDATPASRAFTIAVSDDSSTPPDDTGTPSLASTGPALAPAPVLALSALLIVLGAGIGAAARLRRARRSS
jgi:CSLREA domain-containing protein